MNENFPNPQEAASEAELAPEGFRQAAPLTPAENKAIKPPEDLSQEPSVEDWRQQNGVF